MTLKHLPLKHFINSFDHNHTMVTVMLLSILKRYYF